MNCPEQTTFYRPQQRWPVYISLLGIDRLTNWRQNAKKALCFNREGQTCIGMAKWVDAVGSVLNVLVP